MYHCDAQIGQCGGIAHWRNASIECGIIIVSAKLPYFPHLVLRPFLQTSHTKIIAIVAQQFIKTRLGDIKQFYLCLTRCGGGCGAFDYILFAASGSLYHLIDSPVSFAISANFFAPTKKPAV